MLSIGEFSKICMVSSKALRYYDEIGLIKPSCIGENGYRYYAVPQLRQMLLINKLKRYDFTLDEIKELLQDKARLYDALICQRNRLLARKLEHEKLAEEISVDITHLTNGAEIMSYIEKLQVKLVENGPVNILSSRQHMSVKEYDKYYGKLYERIAKEQLTVTGLPLAIYHDKEFSPENNDTELAVPIKEVTADTRELPRVECAMAVHTGPYENLYEIYARIIEWIEQNGYEVADAPREYYVDEKTPIVEVYCPVKKR